MDKKYYSKYFLPIESSKEKPQRFSLNLFMFRKSSQNDTSSQLLYQYHTHISDTTLGAED